MEEMLILMITTPQMLQAVPGGADASAGGYTGGTGGTNTGG